MKQLLLFGILLLSLNSVLHAQDTVVHQPVYRAFVHTQGHETKGYLASIVDSAIYLSIDPAPFMYNAGGMNAQKVDLRYIDWVKVRKKGALGRSMLIGSLIGLAGGLIIGLTTYSEPEDILLVDKGAYVFGSALVGTALGFGGGAIVGAVSAKKYMINGDWKSLQEMKAMLHK